MENQKRPETMARITTKELADKFIDEQVAAVRAQVGDRKVLLALSGALWKSSSVKPISRQHSFAVSFLIR